MLGKLARKVFVCGLLLLPWSHLVAVQNSKTGIKSPLPPKGLLMLVGKQVRDPQNISQEVITVTPALLPKLVRYEKWIGILELRYAVNDTLKQLKQFHHLKELYITNCDITDAALVYLKDLRGLTKLGLERCYRVNGSGFKYIRNFPHLAYLFLTASGIRDPYFSLQGFKHLVEVDLDRCSAGDFTLASMKDLKNLVNLDLTLCRDVTDKGLNYLGSLKKLKTLDISGCPKITEVGVKNLQEKLPGLKILRQPSY